MSGPALVIDPASPVPPYEQLRSQLATVRQLAADLGLAPNTVARAYRELEADGVIATQGRRGTFVSSDALAPQGSRAELATDFVAAARRAGLTLAEATRLVEHAWTS